MDESKTAAAASVRSTAIQPPSNRCFLHRLVITAQRHEPWRCWSAQRGFSKYLSDPASAVTDAAKHLEDAVKDSPLEAPIDSLAASAGQDKGLVALGVVCAGLFVGLFIIGVRAPAPRPRPAPPLLPATGPPVLIAPCLCAGGEHRDGRGLRCACVRLAADDAGEESGEGGDGKGAPLTPRARAPAADAAPILRGRPGSVPAARKLTERGARQMVPVYWIVFSGLLVLEQFGLLPIMIGNSLYALIKGAALFYMWEGPGSSQVFGLLKPFVETKKD